jgi:hypothetical protein
MPWILELGERSQAVQDARERLTVAVPGLRHRDDVCSDDLVGVIVCGGPSRCLFEPVWSARRGAGGHQGLVAPLLGMNGQAPV